MNNARARRIRLLLIAGMVCALAIPSWCFGLGTAKILLLVGTTVLAAVQVYVEDPRWKKVYVYSTIITGGVAIGVFMADENSQRRKDAEVVTQHGKLLEAIRSAAESVCPSDIIANIVVPNSPSNGRDLMQHLRQKHQVDAPFKAFLVIVKNEDTHHIPGLRRLLVSNERRSFAVPSEDVGPLTTFVSSTSAWMRFALPGVNREVEGPARAHVLLEASSPLKDSIAVDLGFGQEKEGATFYDWKFVGARGCMGPFTQLSDIKACTFILQAEALPLGWETWRCELSIQGRSYILFQVESTEKIGLRPVLMGRL